ncbi:MAG: hypothetical protein KAY31_04185 [Flavobacterium sp.]|nr:hypothetical protein [Flavobacterium sp.]
MKNTRVIIILITVAVLLLIPFIAMQFTAEVNWSLFDFIIAAVLLLGSGLLIEFVLRTIKSKQSRIILCIVILLALFLIWAELAVGIFGTPFAGS